MSTVPPLTLLVKRLVPDDSQSLAGRELPHQSHEKLSCSESSLFALGL